jgi:membrane protein DedA with SNARE-associated domain
VLWAWAGAAIGLSTSYSIGLLLGPRLRNVPLIKDRPAVLEKARRLFSRYGQAAILIAAFSGPLRATVASVAAVAGMRRVHYELASIFSALLWAVVSIAIGAVPGLWIERDSVWVLVAPVLIPLGILICAGAVFGVRAMTTRQH